METEITFDGKPVLTVEQLAARYGITASSMRAALARLGDDAPRPRTYVGRKPLYDPDEMDAVMAARPGRGAPGVSRPHRPPGDRHAMAERLRAHQ